MNYPDLANYLQNLSTLIVEHSKKPLTPETIQQASQYKQALDAVYPLISNYLNLYSLNTITNSKNISMKSLKYPPPTVQVGEVGTYKIGTDRYGFTVVNVNGRKIDIQLDGSNGTKTLEWRKPGRWVLSGTKARDFRGEYILGVKENYLDPNF